MLIVLFFYLNLYVYIYHFVYYDNVG